MRSFDNREVLPPLAPTRAASQGRPVDDRQPRPTLHGYVASGGDTVSCAPGPASGDLSLSVTGLPDGVAAGVQVAGSGIALDLMAAGSIRLPAATYPITVMPVLGTEAVARTVYDGVASSPSATVAAGETATIDVAYARRPGTNRVWTSGGSGVHGFAADAWEASGPVTPTVTLSLPPGLQSTQDLVVAPSGDLFTVAWTDGGILRYTAADLDTPAAAPAGFVPYPNVSALTWHEGRLYAMQAGLAFDADGRSWQAFRQALVRLEDPLAPIGSTSTAPDTVLTLITAAPRYVLTYRDGTLYTAPCGLGTVERFDDVDAAHGVATVAPTATIGVGLDCVVSIGVDASDRFWLADGRDVAGRYPDLGTLAEGATVDPLVTTQHGQFLSAGSLAFHARALGEP